MHLRRSINAIEIRFVISCRVQTQVRPLGVLCKSAKVSKKHRYREKHKKQASIFILVSLYKQYFTFSQVWFSII